MSTPNQKSDTKSTTTYAQSYAGVRQDSGDPSNFVKMVREFYDGQGITDKKVIVFSDSLNIEHCLEYKTFAEEAGFSPTFGVGTFFTSRFDIHISLMTVNTDGILDDYTNKATREKSKPLNIVIKIATANGSPAVKLSDNLGKNTGDHAKVLEVKKTLGYVEKTWEEGDESHRWTK